MTEEQLQIKIGDTAFIKLESLATSGYVWNYSIDDNSIVGLKKKANEFQKPIVAGYSGMEVFAIKGLKKGTAKISFSQSRQWEKSNDATKSRSFTIIVSGD